MHWDLVIKLKLTVVLLGAVALFAGLGFWAIPRVDPGGPFLLANLSGRPLAVIVLAGMIALCGAVGGLWLGRDLPHVGWLVVGAGWAGLALRSPTIGQALMFTPPGEATQRFYLVAMGELLIGSALTAVGCLLATWMARMVPRAVALDGEPADALDVSDRAHGDAATRRPRPPAAGVGHPTSKSAARLDVSDAAAETIAAFIATGVLGALLFIQLLARSELRGQVVFALAGGYFLAALASHQVFQTRSPWGQVSAVIVCGAVCYALAIFGIAGERAFDFQAPLAIAQPLPVDFLGVALPAAMAGYYVSFWMLQMRQEASARGEPARQPARG